MSDGRAMFAAGGCGEEGRISKIGKINMTAAGRTAELVFDTPCGRGQVRMYMPAELTAQERADMFAQIAVVERGNAIRSD